MSSTFSPITCVHQTLSVSFPPFPTHALTHRPKHTHTGNVWVGGGVCVGKLGAFTCVTVSHHQ